MYCLNTSVQPGDIILVRGAAKTSKLISIATKGHFSHACVVISNTRAIEAIFDGVKMTSLSRFVVLDKKNIKVLRPKFDTVEQKSFLQSSIEDFSYAHQGKGYNLADAAKSIFGLDFAINDDSLFCSQLVAAVFEEAKFPLFKKRAHNVNPNDYLKSDKLLDISEEAIVEIPEYIKKRAEKNGKEINPIDVKNGGSTSFEPARLLREFVEDCGSIFEQHNLRRPNTVLDIVDRLTDGLNQEVFEDIDRKITVLYREKMINEKLRIFSKKDAPQTIDFFKSEYINYGREFADSEYVSLLQLIPEYKRRLDQNIIYINFFKQINEKCGMNFALEQVEYYQIVIDAVCFVLQETEKQKGAYEDLYAENCND